MRRFSKGFSLVELMIVVAIIGILAAIAIPNFVSMQLKSKRSEVAPNVDGIKTAELAYDAAFDGYVAATANPTSAPGKIQRVWTATGSWVTLGWSPDGEIRGSYAVSESTVDFLVQGSCDVDGDSVMADYSATTSVNASLADADQNVY